MIDHVLSTDFMHWNHWNAHLEWPTKTSICNTLPLLFLHYDFIFNGIPNRHVAKSSKFALKFLWLQHSCTSPSPPASIESLRPKMFARRSTNLSLRLCRSTLFVVSWNWCEWDVTYKVPEVMGKEISNFPSFFNDHVHVYHDHHLSLVSPLSSWLLLHCHHIQYIFFIVISQWPQLVACFHLSCDQTLGTFHHTHCLIGIQITGSLDSLYNWVVIIIPPKKTTTQGS